MSTEEKISNKVCFNNNCFSVELAKTPQERSAGLMFRENLPKGAGMLFIFEEEGIYNFWMKNTLIPLDIIWINGNREVVFIAKNLQPCKEEQCISVNPEQFAKYVLEVNGGAAEEIGLTLGSKLNF